MLRWAAALAAAALLLGGSAAAETDPLLKGLKKSGLVEDGQPAAAAAAKTPSSGCLVGHEWVAFDSKFATQGGAALARPHQPCRCASCVVPRAGWPCRLQAALHCRCLEQIELAESEEDAAKPRGQHGVGWKIFRRAEEGRASQQTEKKKSAAVGVGCRAHPPPRPPALASTCSSHAEISEISEIIICWSLSLPSPRQARDGAGTPACSASWTSSITTGEHRNRRRRRRLISPTIWGDQGRSRAGQSIFAAPTLAFRRRPHPLPRVLSCLLLADETLPCSPTPCRRHSPVFCSPSTTCAPRECLLLSQGPS